MSEGVQPGLFKSLNGGKVLYVWVDFSAQEDIKEFKLAADLAASAVCLDCANKLGTSELDK